MSLSAGMSVRNCHTPPPREVNQAARDDLPRGLTALNLSLDQATLPGKLIPDAAPVNMVGAGGMSLASVDDAAMLFDGVALDRTPAVRRRPAPARCRSRR
jgi:methylmalonyl-CoA mutase (EC 5.4.99.2)